MNRRRLYRSPDDRWLAGVAAGVADYFDLDPVIVRIIWIISVPISGGFMALVYVIMAFAVPVGSDDWTEPSPWAPGGAPVGQSGAPGAGQSAPADAASAPASTSAPGGAASTGPAAGFGAGSPADPTAAGPGPAPAGATDWRWQRRQERWQRRSERWQRRTDDWEHRAEHRGSGGLVFGLLLVLVGGVLAWKEVFPAFDLNLAWPVAIVIFGAVLAISSIGSPDHH